MRKKVMWRELLENWGKLLTILGVGATCAIFVEEWRVAKTKEDFTAEKQQLLNLKADITALRNSLGDRIGARRKVIAEQERINKEGHDAVLSAIGSSASLFVGAENWRAEIVSSYAGYEAQVGKLIDAYDVWQKQCIKFLSQLEARLSGQKSNLNGQKAQLERELEEARRSVASLIPPTAITITRRKPPEIEGDLNKVRTELRKLEAEELRLRDVRAKL